MRAYHEGSDMHRTPMSYDTAEMMLKCNLLDVVLREGNILIVKDRKR